MIQLDLPRFAGSTAAKLWLAAAMPHAQIYQLQKESLISLSTGVCVGVTADLKASLAAPALEKHIIIAEDETGANWRLRKPLAKASDLWLLQSIAESRTNILSNFRAVLGAKLANSLQHELRNPLNALGLQCDLLSRTLKPTASGEVLVQAASRVSQMKDRLRDLLERQNSMVSLWLSEPNKDTRIDLPILIDEVLRLLRSYGSQREVRVQAENPDELIAIAAPSNSVPIRLVLIAIGMLAIDSSASVVNSNNEDVQVLLQMKTAVDGVVELRVSGLMMQAGLNPELLIADLDDWFASLALLLDDQSIEISRESSNKICLRIRP